MVLKGEKGAQELEVGKVYKGVKRLINSVWTCTFVPTRDGIFILDYNRKDEEGYDKEKELLQVEMGEDDHRIVKELVVSDPKKASFDDNQNTDVFKVKNPEHIFSYENQKLSYDDLRNDPDLAHLRSSAVAKDYGLGESSTMKHLMLFEAFIKQYGDRISQEDFKAIKPGSRVMYMGGACKVLDNDGYVLNLENSAGNKYKVNFSMFIEKGALTSERDGQTIHED